MLECLTRLGRHVHIAIKPAPRSRSNGRLTLDILRQYQKAVERQMFEAPGPPMKLSEFLEPWARRRDQADAA